MQIQEKKYEIAADLANISKRQSDGAEVGGEWFHCFMYIRLQRELVNLQAEEGNPVRELIRV
jgi:hypothetical protein